MNDLKRLRLPLVVPFFKHTPTQKGKSEGKQLSKNRNGKAKI